MQLDLSVLNQKGAPALYEDTLANRPTAGFVGRLFVSTDTDELYRDNGATWDLIGGGGGGAVGDGVSILGAGTIANPFNSGLDAILAVGQPLSVDSSFKFNNFNVDFTGTKRVRFQTTSPVKTLFLIDKTTGNINLGFDDCNLDFDQTNKILNTYINSVNIGLNLDFANEKFIFGDVNKSNVITDNFNQEVRLIPRDYTSLFFQIQDDVLGAKLCATYYNLTGVGISLDFGNGSYYYGNYGGSGDRSYLELIDTSKISRLVQYELFSGRSLFCELNAGTAQSKIYSSLNTNAGLKIEFVSGTYEFGNYSGAVYFKAEETGNNITIAGDVLNIVGGVVQGTSGPPTGDHLQVTINGTPYVIELKQP